MARTSKSTQSSNGNTQGTSQEIAVHRKEELQEAEGTREGTYFRPNVDIYETSKALTLVADVPGTAAEDFEIDLRDNLLTIVGSVREVEPGWQPLYSEYRVGHFMRQFRVGQQIDQTKISAEITDGVLKLTLPKAESAKPRKIEVRTA
ncbi:Hsp20/alpha crystallin family protein [Bradymonadaceae bacterium TMQ3]|uniref:Hsp20/alpha crystallin family protein n=1 Tax=Lujinxingia sediminis TaxID=2480984 RepID=A0ABY0CNZ6_9DELT|nr:Hsp20/alpha crystallin family protein [Lujinxingia sediminis]RDV36853.1 Hsp20/alpha crystallin family protein [Bradymonadaceae bacterium TMQ3]RVU42166.1 Hsp20/alpha crystallin family protein [Lujinxingia sediminis]TXC69476.1 Hsp20/alpha crystallin family protein [Bradymonadales bacterium TMQ1]